MLLGLIIVALSKILCKDKAIKGYEAIKDALFWNLPLKSVLTAYITTALIAFKGVYN